MNIDAGEARVGIAAWEWGAYLGDEAAGEGRRACTSPPSPATTPT